MRLEGRGESREARVERLEGGGKEVRDGKTAEGAMDAEVL